MIYPSLPGSYDFGILRIAGGGIGNCLYCYFRAVVFARSHQQRIVAPTWGSIKTGPLLRWERSFRLYGTMFRPHRDEIKATHKLLRLIAHWPWWQQRVRIDHGQSTVGCLRGGLNVVEVPESNYTFIDLYEHRDFIRNRLLEILTDAPQHPLLWGSKDYVAVHIRLGDFLAASPAQVNAGTKAGLRIPIEWYKRTIQRTREQFPTLPVLIFSDGREHELAQLLAIDGVRLHREATDIAELLALAQAKLLIGSNSTFSRWAAFLGNMPSIWLKTQRLPVDKPTDRLVYVDTDLTAICHRLLP